MPVAVLLAEAVPHVAVRSIAFDVVVLIVVFWSANCTRFGVVAVLK